MAQNGLGRLWFFDLMKRRCRKSKELWLTSLFVGFLAKRAEGVTLCRRFQSKAYIRSGFQENEFQIKWFQHVSTKLLNSGSISKLLVFHRGLFFKNQNKHAKNNSEVASFAEVIFILVSCALFSKAMSDVSLLVSLETGLGQAIKRPKRVKTKTLGEHRDADSQAWIDVSGSSARDVARQLREQQLMMPGAVFPRFCRMAFHQKRL